MEDRNVFKADIADEGAREAFSELVKDILSSGKPVWGNQCVQNGKEAHEVASSAVFQAVTKLGLPDPSSPDFKTTIDTVRARLAIPTTLLPYETVGLASQGMQPAM